MQLTKNLQKTGGYILQAKSFLPARASSFRFALRPPNSPALLPYFLSSVHSSNFRIPHVLFAALTKTARCQPTIPISELISPSSTPHLVTSLLHCFPLSRSY